MATAPRRPVPARPATVVVAVVAAVVAVALVVAGCSRSDTETAATSTTTSTVPDETTTTTEVPLTEGRQVASFTPSVGECFDRRRSTGSGGSSSGEIVLLLDCDKPHANEVFAVVTTELKDYPGEVALKNLAKLECPKKFEDYVGIPYETSELELGFWLPSQSSWNQGYRKTLGCLVTSGQGPKLVGSVKGAKR